MHIIEHALLHTSTKPSLCTLQMCMKVVINDMMHVFVSFITSWTSHKLAIELVQLPTKLIKLQVGWGIVNKFATYRTCDQNSIQLATRLN